MYGYRFLKWEMYCNSYTAAGSLWSGIHTISSRSCPLIGACSLKSSSVRFFQLHSCAYCNAVSDVRTLVRWHYGVHKAVEALTLPCVRIVVQEGLSSNLNQFEPRVEHFHCQEALFCPSNSISTTQAKEVKWGAEVSCLHTCCWIGNKFLGWKERRRSPIKWRLTFSVFRLSMPLKSDLPLWAQEIPGLGGSLKWVSMPTQ